MGINEGHLKPLEEYSGSSTDIGVRLEGYDGELGGGVS
jgi:hypothetical protein